MTTISQQCQFAYVDEAGDPSLNLSKKGVSPFYVVYATLVDGEKNQSAEMAAQLIRNKYFGQGEMKSSRVGHNQTRREAILHDIKAIGLSFCAFIIDKSVIHRDSGLQHKKSFIKFIHAKLYHRLYRTFVELHVRADQHGHPEFMQSFKSFIKKNYSSDLFDHADFRFVSSARVGLVQVSDMIAGSLLRIYSGKDPKELLNLLTPFATLIQRWPPISSHPDVIERLTAAEQFDHLIEEQSVLQAMHFIRNNNNINDKYTTAQVDTIDYLLFKHEISPSEYVYTDDILKHLNRFPENQIEKETFRMQVIGKLRDQGVLIASSTHGYKIPNSTMDMDSFVTLVDSQTISYIKRLKIARNQILLASNNKYDIVPNEKYPDLAECVSAIDNRINTIGIQ